MNNWMIRRALLGLLTIIIESLQTMGAFANVDEVHQEETPLTPMAKVADAVYHVRLAAQKLEEEINKLPT